MKRGHSAVSWRGSLAYPYPGRSANTRSGLGCPGRRISKKLMVRVRPGVELVCAIFSPTSEFSTLDLPTFERPRNATSGTVADGNCAASAAEVTNLV